MGITGRPLPGRQNIVLTRDTSFTAEGATVIHSVDELAGLELMDREVMVIGGAQIYGHLLSKMQKLYVSEVQGEYAADTWFPEFAHYFLRSTPVEQFDGFRLVLYEK